MTESTRRIGPLMKVALRVTLSSGGDGPARSTPPAPMEFIYGIGKEGLTPFENALSDKAVGDRLTLSAGNGELPQLLGHLFPLLPSVPEWRDGACWMEIVIIDLSHADGREVIKAMAGLVDGCGGGCGCGCGG